MAKLRKLRVHGFRGILNDVEIDFSDKNRSLILIGDNGTGKSSFVDAVEWVLTGRIEHLAREGCGDVAYRHRLLPDGIPARVEVTTSLPPLVGGRILDGTLRAQFDPDNGPLAQFVANARGDMMMLRYGQMRDFVDKTKTEKLQYLAEILGLGALSQLRDELLTALNKVQKGEDYRYLVAQIKDYEKRLNSIVGLKRFDQARAITFADELRAKLGGQTAICDLASLRASTDELLAHSQRDQRAREIMTLRQHLATLQAGREHTGVLNQLDKVAEAVAKLAADKAAVDQIALAELYRAGQTVIERRLGDPSVCPLCGCIVNRQELADHLCTQLESIQDIAARLEALRVERRGVRDALDAYQTWLAAGRTAAASLTLAEAKSFVAGVDLIFSLIAQWENAAVSDSDPLQPLPSPSSEERQAAQDVTNALAAVVIAVEEHLRGLEGSAQEKLYYDQLGYLDQLTSGILALDRTQRQKAHYDRQITTLERVHTDCEKLERQALEEVLAIISADVNKYYLQLHPNEGFDAIRLWPTKERGIEFEFGFHGERVSPPARLLSESHLNTLGACLFLASARHFNRHTHFLILDDIINSVDAGHRSPLARLLRDEFGDFQLVLMTHDRMWFDILRRTAPNWLTLEISEWSYAEGLRFKHRPGDLEDEARRQLDQNDTEAAGTKARRWLERVLKERCLDLGVPVAFRFNDRNEERMSGELLPALRTYVKNTPLYAANRTLFNDLEASQFIGNQLSHDNTYLSAPPQRADVELFLQDIRRLDSLFLCSTCGTYIATEHTPDSANRKRCKCGQLELR